MRMSSVYILILHLLEVGEEIDEPDVVSKSTAFSVLIFLLHMKG